MAWAMNLLQLMLALAALAGSAFASAHGFDQAPRASDEELDRMRGGFVVDWNGQSFLMPFSIDGVERLTQINGQTYVGSELTPTQLNPFALIPLGSDALGRSDGVAGVAVTAAPQVSLRGDLIFIQNGAGNAAAVPQSIPADALGMVIQNSLNDQVIRNVTTLNITLEAQMLAAQARLSGVLNQALQGLR